MGTLLESIIAQSSIRIIVSRPKWLSVRYWGEEQGWAVCLDYFVLCCKFVICTILMGKVATFVL